MEGQTTDGNTAHLYSKDVFAWLPTDTASNTIQICASLWKGRSSISPSQTSYISTWCSCTLQLYSSPNMLISSSSCISVNYTQNVAKLLAHVRTVDTTRSSPIFAECLRTRLTQTLLPGHQTTPHFTLTIQ